LFYDNFFISHNFFKSVYISTNDIGLTELILSAKARNKILGITSYRSISRIVTYSLHEETNNKYLLQKKFR